MLWRFACGSSNASSKPFQIAREGDPMPFWSRRLLPNTPSGNCLDHGRGVRNPARRTRLLTRHLEEVWFPSHACHALLSSLFTSLFAGKREAPRPGGVGGPGEAPAGATFKFGARGAQAAQKCKLRRHDFRARAGLKFFLARICWAGGVKRPRL